MELLFCFIVSQIEHFFACLQSLVGNGGGGGFKVTWNGALSWVQGAGVQECRNNSSGVSRANLVFCTELPEIQALSRTWGESTSAVSRIIVKNWSRWQHRLKIHHGREGNELMTLLRGAMKENTALFFCMSNWRAKSQQLVWQLVLLVVLEGNAGLLLSFPCSGLSSN